MKVSEMTTSGTISREISREVKETSREADKADSREVSKAGSNNATSSSEMTSNATNSSAISKETNKVRISKETRIERNRPVRTYNFYHPGAHSSGIFFFLLYKVLRIFLGENETTCIVSEGSEISFSVL